MRIRSIVLACAAASMVVGITGTAAAECTYRGEENALPTAGAPLLVYANGEQGGPSGFVGISDGSGENYGQVSGSPDGVQFEGKSASAGQSGFVNTAPANGSC